jgi:hypothetical protein
MSPTVNPVGKGSFGDTIMVFNPVTNALPVISGNTDLVLPIWGPSQMIFPSKIDPTIDSCTNTSPIIVIKIY